ncbi:phage holin family protein [Enterococcus sp.]|uniref:phage holin family protein n=1 Tax=Enterococcus sp. TaxID=35783 RepID=UPI003C739A0F
MEQILKYVVGDGLIMIPTLFVIGMIIKGTAYVRNELIPVILLVVSIGLTPLILGGYNAPNIVQAILVTGAAVLVDQTIKQVGYLKVDEEDELDV